jgi:thiaminase/transcriptional activator TenA
MTGLAADLFADNLGIARRCLDGPFVRGIAGGTLGPEAFRSYVGQDAFFLRAFGRAYAVAAARAPDPEAFGAFLELARGALGELELHAKYAADLGIDLESVAPMPATLAYTDFLTATAWHADLGPTLAAMAPCMRLYAWLGTELAKDGIPDHEYAAWIRTYSAKDFGGLADLLDSLLDRHATDGPEVRAAYAKAMGLELSFFDAFAHGR